ncbi:DEAD/DEAH box helicase [Mobiluncus mulieris]|uniref:DEAD/DEAH box helicase n=1 Tax=Mobiluncus mulieris TaxID=2052 RepID=A0A7Y0U017_9ACTO|nr:DEAD/DEAH box helicase [Mobiluncus mulieris]NMW64454.1 DEAD/DEAH box helicase [Mobiluncus mulieris]
MKYIPHDYQTKAISHLLAHPHAVLLLDMGLGKTVITLTAVKALLATGEISKVLIVAPKRVAVSTWPGELDKWDNLAGVSCALLTGTEKGRLSALKSSAPIHIINRENVAWLCDQVGGEWPYDMLVVDELSSFKSPKAKRFKALKKFTSRMKRVVGLTGTPAPNGLLDLWAQYMLVDGGESLGRFFPEYRDKWFHPTKYVYGQPVDYRLDEGAEEAIYRAVAPITLSMRAVDHLTLPGLSVVDQEVELPPRAFADYVRLKRDMVAEFEGRDVGAVNAAVLVGKLQQYVGGAVYAAPLFGEDTVESSNNPVLPRAESFEVVHVHNAKLDALEDVLEAANGQPVLVAYWFQHELARLKARFPEAVCIDKPESIVAWNRGEIPVGLIHPASAGHGLNLQAGGRFLVWFTLPWNLELYQQTNARLYRQGQQYPVVVTRLVARNTIDQRVVKALETKKTTQNNLITNLREEIGCNK